MTWVLCYDVVEDRRRARFHKKLKGFLTPVQKSVFEGDLTPAAMAKVEELIYRELDLQTDSVRMYPMTASCRGMLQTFGTAARLSDPDAPFVV